MSEAEEEIASALSLPELPTVKQQIRSIEERQAALYAGEISVPSDVVDEVLRKGGNKDRSHLRMIYNFMIEQTPEEYTEFVRREYGEGGIGLVIGGKEYSVWYDELGCRLQLDTPYTTRSWIRLFYHGRKFPDGFTSFYARVNMHHSLFWKLPGQMQSKNMQRYWRICSVIWQKAYQNLCLKITRYFMAVFQRC